VRATLAVGLVPRRGEFADRELHGARRVDPAVGFAVVSDDEGAQPLVPRCDVVQRRLQHRQVELTAHTPARGDDVPRAECAEGVIALVEGAHEGLAGRKAPPVGRGTGTRALFFDSHRAAAPLVGQRHRRSAGLPVHGARPPRRGASRFVRSPARSGTTFSFNRVRPGRRTSSKIAQIPAEPVWSSRPGYSDARPEDRGTNRERNREDVKLTTTTCVTVDGVMQGLGAADEDRRGGFERGGWQGPLWDDDAGAFMNDIYARADAFLFGRRTYEIFAGSWEKMADPGNNVIGAALNTKPKYVASNTITEPSWADTTVLSGDLAAGIEELTSKPGASCRCTAVVH
jgi:dihydrofolate reductase